VGVPKGREAGEIGGNYATLHNISQSKKDKRKEAKKKGAGAGIARCRRREVWTPLSPPPLSRVPNKGVSFHFFPFSWGLKVSPGKVQLNRSTENDMHFSH